MEGKLKLGLDLGSGSIGWAVIRENDTDREILSMGSRIVPIESTILSDFNKGNDISINADRTTYRSTRRNYDRYQLRRHNLTKKLNTLGMLPDETLMCADQKTLWGLRAKAATEQIGLQELGRVLYHINQKRGYKPTKAEYSDKKQTDYVKDVNNRYDDLKEKGMTVGENFYAELLKNPDYRCKNRVLPRIAYIEEFDKIMQTQQQFYPEVLTDANIEEIRDHIIFYQRPLKSCKHLVSVCDFEKHEYTDDNGNKFISGPKVAPKSSPLAQVCKIWESANNITITNKYNEAYPISATQKQEIFNAMNISEKLKVTDLYKILNIKRKDGWQFQKSVETGLQGNTTLVKIANALDVDLKNPHKSKYGKLLEFNLEIIDSNNADTETGEVYKIVSADFEHQTLYKLWHLLYSVEDKDDLEKNLRKDFGITEPEILDNLFKIDFRKQGYAGKSSRFIRRILPYLMAGEMYSTACEYAGTRHSESLTKEENEQRELLDKLPQLKKGELRQPIVEKILNQAINVVNTLTEKYGRFDEIKVELARELKQSKDERDETTRGINKAAKLNETIAKRISEEYGLPPTRSRINKYKMWEETNHTCIYCGKQVSGSDFLNGYDVEVEHIIPRSLYFDDSMTNKACACRDCNHKKGNLTANDFMRNQGEAVYEEYIERINKLNADGKIGRTKLRNLKTSEKNIPTDFIDRQLRETQYISKKAMELLKQVCRNVTATSGSVTDFLRHIWGWDKVLHDLNLPRYEKGDLTEQVTINHNGNTSQEIRIKNWSKRIDHRHHAIDALTIASTPKGIIQLLNHLNTLKDIEFKPFDKQGREFHEKLSKLEKYALSQPHFSYAEVKDATNNILVSFKPGKKVSSTGKRYIYRGKKRIPVQTNKVIPRGALSKETVYGMNQYYNAQGELINRPVVKTALSGIVKPKDVESIVDCAIRELVRARLEAFKWNAKEAFATPLYSDKAQTKEIQSVRCFANLDAIVPVRYDENGKPTGYVQPRNNHHVAFYKEDKGKLNEHIATFWHCVERRKYNIPVIVTDTIKLWDDINARPEQLPEPFLKHLPQPQDGEFQFSMQRNEMFILGMDETAYRDAIESGDKATLAKYLYKVQKLSRLYYNFCLHTETQYEEAKANKKDKRFIRITSIKSLYEYNPHKVYVSLTGEIKPIW